MFFDMNAYFILHMSFFLPTVISFTVVAPLVSKPSPRLLVLHRKAFESQASFYSVRSL